MKVCRRCFRIVETNIPNGSICEEAGICDLCGNADIVLDLPSGTFKISPEAVLESEHLHK